MELTLEKYFSRNYYFLVTTSLFDAKYEGSEMVVAFNPEFLIDGVEATPGDEVVLETLDALKPATLKPTEGTDFLYLLMPVRVS